MPSKTNSPYTSSFNSAIKRGTPCWTAINNIANRWNKTPNFVGNSLFKAGHVWRQKFNGQWIYWAASAKKSNATNWKPAQFNMWQNFIDWAVCNGFCTPEQIKNHCGSQQEFMTWCRKFFSKQFDSNSSSKSSPKRKSNTRKSTTARKSSPAKRKTSRRKTTTAKSYKFPRTSASKSRTTRRYRRAA